MSGLRQAALVLHGLADPDRAWMLGQLPPEQAGAVSGLLVELRELGIPNDPSFAAQALGAPHGPATGERHLASQAPAEALRAATPKQMARVLQGEPPGFVAVLLAAGQWPWRASDVLALEPASMCLVQHAGHGIESGPRLRAQVVAAVARRLRDGVTAGAPPTRLQRVRGLLAQLRRRGGRR